MSINLGIIDQRARKLAVDLAAEFETRLNIKNDEVKQRSTAFVFLVVKTVLDLPHEEALDCLTEGGNDFGVDAIHVGHIEDGEFVVTLFQGKYKQDLTRAANFPQTGVEKVIQAIRYLFNPDAEITTNPMLTKRIEEIRSLIRDGQIPRIRAVLCNNGLTWQATAQQLIDRAAFPAEQVSWGHVNHDEVVRLMQAAKQVDDTLRLAGKAIVEDFDYCRVLVGTYRRHRSEASLKATDLSSGTAAEAVLSIWRHRPHQAKFMGREHFGKLYDVIFTDDLNGTQVVIATLLFRIAENRRRRPPPGAPDFVAYASCFLAMLMGRFLLTDLNITLGQLDHRNFAEAKAKLDQNEDAYFTRATAAVEAALKKLYGVQMISLQRLAATFRRGDLIQELGIAQ